MFVHEMSAEQQKHRRALDRAQDARDDIRRAAERETRPPWQPYRWAELRTAEERLAKVRNEYYRAYPPPEPTP